LVNKPVKHWLFNSIIKCFSVVSPSYEKIWREWYASPLSLEKHYRFLTFRRSTRKVQGQQVTNRFLTRVHVHRTVNYVSVRLARYWHTHTHTHTQTFGRIRKAIQIEDSLRESWPTSWDCLETKYEGKLNFSCHASSSPKRMAEIVCCLNLL